jgi:predicted nucleic-acid-binding protein
MGWPSMKATVDTNILLRAFLDDHPTQSPAAQEALNGVELLAVTLPTLCEFAWVLRKGYKRSRQELSVALETIIGIPNISLDRPAVEAGLALVAAGGDFADGVISYEGKRLGGDIFFTFDRAAAELLAKAGIATSLLTSAPGNC